MPQELEIVSFATAGQLRSWLEMHHATHPGVWAHLQKTNSAQPSVSFHDVLEARFAYGWSESTRRSHDTTSYLQKFSSPPGGPRLTDRRRTRRTRHRNGTFLVYGLSGIAQVPARGFSNVGGGRRHLG